MGSRAVSVASHAFVEHTGEIALRLDAPSLPALFVEAARGLLELIVGEGVALGEPTDTLEVSLEARDVAGLLVAFLDELIISFASSCHGAGRALSRTAAKKRVPGHVLRKELESRGIVVRCPSNAELAEEAPLAYKDVDRVVDVVARAGIARKVARLTPLGVIKG